MSDAAPTPSRRKKAAPLSFRQKLRRSGFKWAWRGLLGFVVLVVLWVWLFAAVNPPAGLYMRQEGARLGGISRTWVNVDDIAPVMLRSVVAAEDANYCNHWGFDMIEIRRAMNRGNTRGASTLSQQVVKNVFLWHGRNWSRKALEAMLTPVVETLWSKRRILEVYLNVAEFDEGVFGVEAAARHYFGVSAAKLSPTQAARLAMVLPNPKARSAAKPSAAQRRRTAAIMDGAQTIAADGRAACFQP
ncbi:monofunctional biosynthetic peptidoglycan transglycosylase [Falsigemmobacter faecalis]|uniref:Biosynthetic peptidoglycan transglycosylase n=1 Tax=Falsigemmobacter faecalis TaxID=2488730 RepID=A0A3P3DJW7_9RHOB|nr:monofunctional biosynthetic peptidoglycan transglycosylase [Falsigemmobacter faecalis]RRH73882.1 monofunctional biosynthetic peptidoglycan transglycosylase [Falsigemmobacter faecalis]